MLLDDVGVGVADANDCTFAHHIELLVKGHHLNAAILVADEALGHAVQRATVISTTLADDLDRVHAQVHVDARARLQLAHRDEDGLAKSALRAGGSVHDYGLLLYHGVAAALNLLFESIIRGLAP